MRKPSATLFALILLLGLTGTVLAAKPFQQDSGPNGVVSMEAEHYDDKVDVGTNVWEEVSTIDGPMLAEGFSNGLAMLIGPTTPLGGRSVNTGYAAGSPHLDFQINFVKTGTHYVWLLASGFDGNSDSAHAGLDGLEIDTCDRMDGWNNYCRWRSTTMDGPRCTFEITETGVHTLNMYMREDGMTFDKIVLTTNPDFTPEGHGPAESGRGVPDSATGAVPSPGATDVPRDVVLAWAAGPFAATHDVYLGTDVADVDAASRTEALDVLVSQDQTATSYATTGLQYGQTYYWRVDEVNAAPDGAIFKGDLWSFTVEPYAYVLPGARITATAAGTQEGLDPQDTVNGSGLNANDEHSSDGTQMWLSDGTQPNWIQYEFDAVYKVHEMWVWNSNQLIETIIGFGAKEVTIDYSVDGETWTELADVPEFARGTGAATYAHNTTVPFGGALARYVRLTINTSWGGLPQAGLSEVRFFYTPVQARLPQPAPDSTGVDLDMTLAWRAGREAAVHTVYLGTDANTVAEGVAPSETVADNTYAPTALEFGTTYYWRVDEVNDVETPSVFAGEVWNFTTREYALVDDFESYTDDIEAEATIWHAWIDGLTTAASGSQVGYDVAPFAEATIVYGGKQSMPLKYDNAASPFISEAEREFASTQDWTAGGADTLALHFRGNPVGFLETAPGSVTMGAGGVDIWDIADEFRFAYKQLNGDGVIVARIDSLGNSDPWAKAGLMIRDTLDPGAKNLMGYVTPDGRVGLQFRQLPAGTSDSTRTEPGAVTLPHWLRVTRTGMNIKVEHSADGTTWEPIVEEANPTEPTSRDIPMNATIYVGLAVTSHNADAMTTAQFSNVSTTGAITGAWQAEAIGVDQPANDPAPLYVTLRDSAGKSKTVVHDDPTATILDTWQQWRIPLGSFTGVNMARVKSLVLGVGDPGATQPGGAGLLYIDDIGVGRPAPTNP